MRFARIVFNDPYADRIDDCFHDEYDRFPADIHKRHCQRSRIKVCDIQTDIQNQLRYYVGNYYKRKFCSAVFKQQRYADFYADCKQNSYNKS